MPLKDSVFMCEQTIDASIALIFEGRCFFYVKGFQLDQGASKKFQIEIPPPPKFVHFSSFLLTGLGASLSVCEGSDRVGTAVKTTRNANRNIDDESLVSVYEGVSGGSTDGIEIKQYLIGANTGNPLVDTGGTANDMPKVILKKDTKYCLDIGSQANGNNITLGLWWFEFDSKVGD